MPTPFIALIVSVLTAPTLTFSFPLFNPTQVRSSNPLPAVILPPVALPRSVTPFAGRTLAVTRRQSEEMPRHIMEEREPSCSELRSMWRHMRRMSRQMEMSNEIPRIPDPFVSSAYDYKTSKYPDPNPYSAASASKGFHIPNRHGDRYDPGSRKSHQMVAPTFGKIIRDPEEDRLYYTKSRQQMTPERGPLPHLGFDDFDDNPRYPSKVTYKGRERMPGRFSNIPLPEESLGIFGTVVNSPEEKARYREREMRPPEMGPTHRWLHDDRSRLQNTKAKYHYGSVVSFSQHNGRRSRPVAVHRNHPTGGFAEYPTEVGQRTNSAARVERIDKISGSGRLETSCIHLHNKTCKTDFDCFCKGSPKLFCAGARCRPLFKPQKYGKQNNLGKSWYVEPFEGSNLVDYRFKRDKAWSRAF